MLYEVSCYMEVRLMFLPFFMKKDLICILVPNDSVTVAVAVSIC